MLGRIRFLLAAMLLMLWPLEYSAGATVGFKPAQSYAVGTAPETVSRLPTLTMTANWTLRWFASVTPA